MSRYAVVAEDANGVEDFTAIFDDETVAEEWCEKINDDPDYGCRHVVVRVSIKRNAITEDEA